MIKFKGLTKKYNKKVFKTFNYSFKNKGLYIISGSSGSGKTTLLNILSGNDKSFIGDLGVKGTIFYLKDRNNFISSLTLKENYYLFELVNNKKIEYFIDVKKLLRKKVNKLSLGEIQLAQLVLALNSDCEIIMLDEPMSALENSNLMICSSLIENLAKEKLIIISSHNTKYFNKYKKIDMDNIKSIKQKKFDSFDFNHKKKYLRKYSFYYLKKVWFSKLLFLFSLVLSIFGFFYINSYSSNLLELSSLQRGAIVEKESDLEKIDDTLFYEVCKKLAKYIIDYNANYYNSSLYASKVQVDGYYIDNGIALSSFKYVENDMKSNEVIISFNYNNFCRNNVIFNCDESYLKTLLVNKKVDGLDLYIHNIFNGEDTSFYINDRFYKVNENNEYVEYYFDTKKEYINDLFGIIKEDELLGNFDFIKIGETDDLVRYKVEISNSKIINDFEYDKYIVCLDEGYNCLDYLNPFTNLVSIDSKNEIDELSLQIYDNKIYLDEIVISSSLSIYLNKGIEETVNFYFEYKDIVHEISLNIVDVIEDDHYCIYHNSGWSYDFFKEILKFDNEDLIVKKMLVFDGLKEGYLKSENTYLDMFEEINLTFFKIKKVTFILNILVTSSSVIVLFFLELFFNKFKKEYLAYLHQLNVEKKNALSIP